MTYRPLWTPRSQASTEPTGVGIGSIDINYDHVAFIGDSYAALANQLFTSGGLYHGTLAVDDQTSTLTWSSGSMPTLLPGEYVSYASAKDPKAMGTFQVRTVPSATEFTGRALMKDQQDGLGYGVAGLIYVNILSRVGQDGLGFQQWAARHGRKILIVANEGNTAGNWGAINYGFEVIRRSTAGIVFCGHYNDPVFEGDYITDKYGPEWDKLLAQGRVLVIPKCYAPTEPTSTNVAAWNTALENFAATRPRVITFDPLDYLTSVAGDYDVDEVHWSPKFCSTLSAVLETSLDRWSTSETDDLPTSTDDLLTPDPMFSNITGGTFSSGTNSSGTVPQDWVVYRSSTDMVVVGSNANRTNPSGKKAIFTMAPTAAGQTLVFKSADFVGSCAAGMWVYGVAEVDVSGMTNLGHLWAGFDFDTGIGTQEYGIWGYDYSGTGVSTRFDQTARTLKIITQPIQLRTLPARIRFGIGVKFDGAQSNAILRISRCGVINAESFFGNPFRTVE